MGNHIFNVLAVLTIIASWHAVEGGREECGIVGHLLCDLPGNRCCNYRCYGINEPDPCTTLSTTTTTAGVQSSSTLQSSSTSSPTSSATTTTITGTSTRGPVSQCPSSGQAETFVLLAATTITNTGNTVISGGNIGVSPGTAITGFPPGTISGGSISSNSQSAKADMLVLDTQLSGYACTKNFTTINLGFNRTLTPGVYCFSDSITFDSILRLDAKGNSGALFIFRTTTTVITPAGSSIVLYNWASPCNIFWQVGTSATLGANSKFKGVVIAKTSITTGQNAVHKGRLFAREAAITLDTNTVTSCSCK